MTHYQLSNLTVHRTFNSDLTPVAIVHAIVTETLPSSDRPKHYHVTVASGKGVTKVITEVQGFRMAEIHADEVPAPVIELCLHGMPKLS